MLFALQEQKKKPYHYVIATYEDAHTTSYKFSMNSPLQGQSVQEFTTIPEEALLFDTYNKAKRFAMLYKLNVNVVTLVAKNYMKIWKVHSEPVKVKSSSPRVKKEKKPEEPKEYFVI